MWMWQLAIPHELLNPMAAGGHIYCNPLTEANTKSTVVVDCQFHSNVILINLLWCSHTRETCCHQAPLTVSTLFTLRYICSITDIIYIYIYKYIYIYIFIHRQTVSLYHKSSAWVDTQDAWSWDRNPSNFTLDLVSYCSANKRTTSVREL